MTRAVCFSDSHGDAMSLRFALDGVWAQTGRVDAYIFLGDGLRDFEDLEDVLRAHDPQCDLYCVRGNCDFMREDAPAAQIIYLGTTPVFITHGHLYQVKSGLGYLDDAAHDRGCDVALYGHTHSAAMDFGQTLMVNPGSAADGRIALLEFSGSGLPKVKLLRF